MGKVWKLPPLPKVVIKPPTVDWSSGSEGAEVSFQVIGTKSLQANLLALGKPARDAAGIVIAQIAADVIEDARENYVPYMDGYLRDSAGSDEYVPAAGTDLTQIAMWFGGDPAIAPAGTGNDSETLQDLGIGGEKAKGQIHDPKLYALIQHEDLAFKHPNIGPVSDPQNKYLEKPFDDVRPEVLPRIAAAIAETLGISMSSAVQMLDDSVSDIFNGPSGVIGI